MSQAEIELCSTVLRDLFDHVRDAYETSDPGTDTEQAYRDVLDKLAELEKAKRAELFGPAEGGGTR